MANVSNEVIAQYLEGRDPQEFIVGIEAEYWTNDVKLIINPPEAKKHIQRKTLKPFLYMKEGALDYLCNGNRIKFKTELRKANIKVKVLNITGQDGNIPDRLDRGFKYMFETTLGTYNDLINFFRKNGLDIFKCEVSIKKLMGIPFVDPLPEGTDTKLFMTLAPAEQYLIQSGKRLFKGMDDYSDIHRLQFDIETTGLDPNKDRIFQIGIKDNRGFEKILEIRGETKKECRSEEKKAIEVFFAIIDYLKPDIIAGYNSEFFDWAFFFERCKKFNLDIKKISRTLNPEKPIRRKKSTVKFGADTEHYEQTMMWGYNIIDVVHAVRRAQAINSDIKGWGLKYITKYAKANKENRVYVPGDKIFKTWDNNVDMFAFNNVNGDWYKITDEKPLEKEYEEVKGAYIVERYLLDDLWETEQVDNKFNQASFLLSKIVPTGFMRSTTMGTAALWKLLMIGWSYENNLGIPDYEPKRSFTGGLSRLLEVGYAKDVVKLDYAALYPNIELTHNIFPDLDISGVMKGMLLYIASTRDKYKFLMNEAKAKGDSKMADLYDKKQLPLKILANSFFGSLSAPYIFPWGDINCGEETTCRGRQYLRLMVKHFNDNYKFRGLVLDTDGANFAIPGDVEDITFTPKGIHKLTESNKGKILTGVNAVVADFNERYMIGRMGLDIDDICTSTINFSRKNYANNILKKNEDGSDKIKLKTVGNTIKSNKMPIYIEEFLADAIKLLLDDKGYEFIELYYEHVNRIFNYEIPLLKIASKSKVKITMDAYNKKSKQLNAAGNPMPKQAHMELIKAHGLSPGLGDVVYYVNTGKVKSHGDLKSIKDKETGEVEIKLNCKLISNADIEKNPDLTTDEYNVAKYLDSFNKKVKPLLVCFSSDIRNDIMVNMVKDKETKEYILQDRNFFDRDLCALTNGEPYKPEDQDTYDALMTMEDKELLFWRRVCLG